MHHISPVMTSLCLRLCLNIDSATVGAGSAVALTEKQRWIFSLGSRCMCGRLCAHTLVWIALSACRNVCYKDSLQRFPQSLLCDTVSGSAQSSNVFISGAESSCHYGDAAADSTVNVCSQVAVEKCSYKSSVANGRDYSLPRTCLSHHLCSDWFYSTPAEAASL